jgi:methoxymalonate biosynthesis acyl carrier protein
MRGRESIMYAQQTIKTTVKNYIGKRINLDESELDEEMNLFDEGLVNSLFAIELMTFLEKTFEINVGMDDLDMAYYQSIDAISSFVLRKEKEAGR